MAAGDEPRIHGPFPARVTGRDATGVRFKVSAQLEDISAGHCHARPDRHAPSGATLFIATQINRAVAAAFRASSFSADVVYTVAR